MKKMLTLITALAILFSLCACTNVNKAETPLHAFSVGEGEYVYFASGNLQYNPSLKQWRFAENAYDFIGKDNELAAADYEGYLDLFGWGANGLSGVEPYSTFYDNSVYGNGHNSIADTEYDFAVAYNKQTGENWRMLTHDEIHYLLMYRENAEKLFGYATIDGVKGLLLLPDDWKCPEDVEFTPSVDFGFENQYNWYYTIGDKENYTYNIFTSEDFEKIEAAGGVFLPASGLRYENVCTWAGESGHYWTSSNYGKDYSNCFCLFEQDLFPEGNFDRSCGLSIRLIRNAE